MHRHPTDLQHIKIRPQTQHRFGNWRWFPLVALAASSVAVLATPFSGYLPQVGPPSLRFRAISQPVTNQFVAEIPAPEPEPEPLVTNKLDKSDITPVNLKAVSTPEPSATVNETATTTPDVTPSEEVVSPQMFLKYFSKSTNGTSATVIAPMDFTPPHAVEPPSSRATYTTGP